MKREDGEVAWLVPLTIVEYGRKALVYAKTKREALEKFRTEGWEELYDATKFKVTKVGAIEREQGADVE